MLSQQHVVKDSLWILQKLGVLDNHEEAWSKLEEYYEKHPEEYCFFRYWTISEINAIAEVHFETKLSSEVCLGILGEYEEWLDTEDEYKFLKDLVEEYINKET